MLALGGIPLVAVVPLLFKFLPESPAYLAAKGDREGAQRIISDYGLDQLPPARVEGDAPEKGRFRTLLTGRLLGAMILFCLAGICGGHLSTA